MPERNNLRPATAETRTGTDPILLYSKPDCVGTYKSISALNNSAPFVPGIYRCNPVTIFTATASSVPLGSYSATWEWDPSVPRTAKGDIAAIMASNIGQTPADSRLLPVWDAQLAQFAINKAYAKLMKADLEVAVMLGELQETIGGLRNPLSALRKFLKNYPMPSNMVRRIGSNPGAVGKDTMNMLSGSWLEWRYGIRPLLKDIQDIYEHVIAQSRAFDEKMRSRGGKTPKTDVNSTRTTSAQLSELAFYGTAKINTIERYHASVCFNLTAPLTWQERYGLDLSSLPGTAWELIPLSFIADWFISVGTWLDSLKAISPKIQVQGVSVTQRVSRIVEVSVTSTQVNGSVVPPGSSKYTVSLEYMKRSCLTPGFNTLTPALNPKAFDVQRTLDALTLLWQKLPRK